MDLISHFFGLDNGSGSNYLFWSGIGSDIGELAIIGGLISIYQRHNCHLKGCWRIGRLPLEGTPYVVCSKHHPTKGLTKEMHQHIKSSHVKMKSMKEHPNA